MGVLDTQVGGDHYKNMKCQPIFLCNAIGQIYGYTGGNIAKYLCRFPHKGKPDEDLQKALHYIDLHQAIAHPVGDVPNRVLQNMASHVEEYIYENKLPGFHAEMLRMLIIALMSSNFSALIDLVKGEIATFPQCGYAALEQPVSLGPAPATKIDMEPYDLKDKNLSASSQMDKIVRELVREQDEAAMSLVKQGYSNICSCTKPDVDGTVVIKVWGTK